MHSTTLYKIKNPARYVFGAGFILQGINHFLNYSFHVSIMPPYLPYPGELVILSGIAEIGLGALLFFPRWQRAAAWGLIALLIAVFPANIHMALNANLYPNIPASVLWARLPFQFLFIAMAYWFTR